MSKVDLSFMEDGVKLIQHYILLLGMIAIGTFVILTIIFKLLKVPARVAYILTGIITIIVFVLAVIVFYAPNIYNALFK